MDQKLTWKEIRIPLSKSEKVRLEKIARQREQPVYVVVRDALVGFATRELSEIRDSMACPFCTIK